MEFKSDNFDKEFSLNQTRKKTTAARGKLPSWLMILAGVAVIGGVVAARQPALRQTDTGTRTTVNLPATQMVSGDHVVFNSINDEQLSSSELEARFLSQGDQALSQNSDLKIFEPTPTASENMLVLAPEQNISTETEDETAPETTAKASAPSKNTAVAWLDDKAYSVSVKPADEMPAAASEHQTDSVNVPVKVLDEAGNEKKQPQTTVFELDGKEYSIQVTELGPEEISADSSAESVVWVDKVPLQVTLSGDSVKESTVSDPKLEMNLNFQITLNPLPAEQTAAMQQERFGTDLSSPAPADEDPFPTAAEESTQVPTEEPQEQNWFASFFNNLFGSDPTATPMPQVTVIALSPTPTVPQPTATPLVINMAPTAEAQGPVRLDGEGTPYTDPVKSPEPADKKEDASSSQTEKPGTDIEGKTIGNNPINGNSSDSSKPEETQPTKAAPSKLDAVIVDSFDKNQNQQQPTSEPKELPHTGGLEGWNIPSLLIMLAGLLLVIIGVRRLRTK